MLHTLLILIIYHLTPPRYPTVATAAHSVHLNQLSSHTTKIPHCYHSCTLSSFQSSIISHHQDTPLMPQLYTLLISIIYHLIPPRYTTDATPVHCAHFNHLPSHTSKSTPLMPVLYTLPILIIYHLTPPRYPTVATAVHSAHLNHLSSHTAKIAHCCHSCTLCSS